MRSAALFLGALLAVAACQRAPEPSTEPAAHADDLVEQAPAIAELGCARVTFDDLAARAHWETFARNLPEGDGLAERWWADAAVRDEVLRREVEAQLLRCDLAEHNALPDRRGVPAELETVDAWQRYRGLSETERATALPGITAERAQQFALEPVLYERWIEAQLPDPDSEELWPLYQRAADQVVLDVIMVPNEPHPTDIARLLREESERIRAFYDDHIHEFRLPRRADIELIRRFADRDARGPDVEARRTLIEARARIVDGESTFEDEARALSEDLTAQNGGRYGLVTRPQFPDLFELEVGELSEVGEDRVGYYLGRLVGWVQPETLPLDDALARRIALRIAREQEPNPQRRALAEEIAAALDAGDDARLTALLDEHGLQRMRTPAFPQPDESVPYVGSAPELAVRIFEELDEPGEQLPSPMLTRNGFAVVRLVERAVPTRDDFERDRERFASRVRAQRRQTAWRAALDAWDIMRLEVNATNFAAALDARGLTAPDAAGADASPEPEPDGG